MILFHFKTLKRKIWNFTWSQILTESWKKYCLYGIGLKYNIDTPFNGVSKSFSLVKGGIPISDVFLNEFYALPVVKCRCALLGVTKIQSWYSFHPVTKLLKQFMAKNSLLNFILTLVVRIVLKFAFSSDGLPVLLFIIKLHNSNKILEKDEKKLTMFSNSSTILAKKFRTFEE